MEDTIITSCEQYKYYKNYFLYNIVKHDVTYHSQIPSQNIIDPKYKTNNLSY